jgi:hypothetical protein
VIVIASSRPAPAVEASYVGRHRAPAVPAARRPLARLSTCAERLLTSLAVGGLLAAVITSGAGMWT